MCPQWEINIVAVRAAKGLPEMLLVGSWGEGGSDTRAWRAGADAGRMAYDHHPDFCSNPLNTLHGSERRDVARFLQPRGTLQASPPRRLPQAGGK